MMYNWITIFLKWLRLVLRVIRHAEHLVSSLYETLATLVLLYYLLVKPKTHRFKTVQQTPRYTF